jgi:hypothetical protein
VPLRLSILQSEDPVFRIDLGEAASVTVREPFHRVDQVDVVDFVQA